MNPLLVLFIVIALIFVFINGFHDSPNIAINAIVSRAIPPQIAFPLTALADFTGPFLFGVAVATTIGDKVLAKQAITIPVAISALLGATIWNIFTWWLGIPSSSSHALVGGFLGAGIIGFGINVVKMEGIYRIFIGLFLSPVMGLVFGWVLMRIIRFLAGNFTPRINYLFRYAEWVTMFSVGLVHGSNDAQNTMGVIALGLVAFGVLPHFSIPFWVVFMCALSIALGSGLGGLKFYHSKGGKFYHIRPIHAFTSQVATTIDVLSCALIGAPVSTTQIISTTTLGAGSAERIQKVRWGLAGQIVLTWVLTIPATGVLSAGIYLLLEPMLK